jgi:acetyl-CoA carboxylase biotin carboxyl carrier protein
MAEQHVETEVSGTVLKIECELGALLSPGDAIVIVESMKMEMPVETPAHGTVLKLLVAVGDAVTEGQVVAVIDIA